MPNYNYLSHIHLKFLTKLYKTPSVKKRWIEKNVFNKKVKLNEHILLKSSQTKFVRNFTFSDNVKELHVQKEKESRLVCKLLIKFISYKTNKINRPYINGFNLYEIWKVWNQRFSINHWSNVKQSHHSLRVWGAMFRSELF